MTLEELKDILEATGFPVAYSHFVESENEPIPEPPYLIYIVAYSSHFSADDQVYKPIENAQIELYTSRKDVEAENIVESLLTLNHIPFATTETFIESEELYQKIYEMRLL